MLLLRWAPDVPVSGSMPLARGRLRVKGSPPAALQSVVAFGTGMFRIDAAQANADDLLNLSRQIALV